MIRLRILGPLALERDGNDATSSLLGQPKRLALLAYLAVRGEQLTTRDTILGLFWPEQSQESARHALSQSLYVLRRELGDAAIVTRGHALGIDPHEVWCDAAQFDAALRRGDRVMALELYHGPLLDGFFLSQAWEFERWLSEIRDELHTRAARAARRLAEEAAAHAHADAMGYARRAAALAPYEERATRLLIELLDRAGDPAAALAAYEGFVRRLQVDCGLQPSAELVALLAAIRSRSVVEPPMMVTTPLVQPPPPSVASAGGPDGGRRPRSSRRTVALLAAATAVVLAVAWAVPHRSRAQHPDRFAKITGRVAVLPFAVDGEGDGDSVLKRDLVELISSRFDGEAIHAIPFDTLSRVAGDSPSALSRRGIGSTVGGTASLVGDAIHLHIEWRKVSDRSIVAQTTVEGPRARLFELLDDAVVQLLAAAQPPWHALARAAAFEHPNLDAFKAFLAGEGAFRTGRFTDAARHFERAAADSTFALAQYRFGEVALWAEDYPLAAADAGGRALRVSARLAEHQRRVIAAFDAWRRGRSDSAGSLLRSVVAADPDDGEAWFQLGETWFHYNPLVGAPAERSREAFDNVVRVDPDNWGALWHLAMLDALEGRESDLDRHLDRLLRLGPETDYQVEIAVLRYCAHRDGSALLALRPTIARMGEGRIFDLVWRCAVYGRDLAGAISLAQPLVERGGAPYVSAAGRLAIATLEMARGRRRAAMAQLDTAASADLLFASSLRFAFATLPGVPHPAGETATFAAAWQHDGAANADLPDRGIWHKKLDALVALALGRPDEVHRIAAVIDAEPDPPGMSGLAHAVATELRARLALTAGDAVNAARELQAERPSIWFGLQLGSSLDSRGAARFILAELLDRTGHGTEAANWYGTLDEFAIADLAYAAPAHLRRAELYRSAGKDSLASVEYARVADLWRDADPELQPITAEARRRSAGAAHDGRSAPRP